MQYLPTNFAAGSPILASDKNATNNAINQLINLAQTYEEYTYEELTHLAHTGALKPGSLYRMTDYCTIAVDPSGEDKFISAEHPFDLILIATSANTFAEKVTAVMHDGDSYFEGQNLAAWQVWYTIENDADKFNWADSHGKGVIYRLIDENQNDCPYDFKNIKFKRYKVAGVTSTSGRTDDCFVGWYMGFTTTDGSIVPVQTRHFEFTLDNNDYVYYYTFNEYDSQNDCSLACYGNTIKRTYDYLENEQRYSTLQILNNIVFIAQPEFNSIPYCNNFGDNCRNMTFFSDTRNNQFGIGCGEITCGSGIINNTFKNNCYWINIAEQLLDSTFENDCSSITLVGDTNHYINFGNHCEEIEFHDRAFNVTIGSNSSDILALKTITELKIGIGAYDILFEDDISTITIENNVTQCEIARKANNITIQSGCSNLSLSTNSPGTMQSTIILAGTRKMISGPGKITVYPGKSQGECAFLGYDDISDTYKIWYPARLVQQ